MAIRNFNGSTDEIITSIGSAGQTGAFSGAMLFRLDAVGRAHTLMNTRTSVPDDAIGFGVQANNAFVCDVNGDGFAGSTTGTAVANRWYIWICTKAAGTVTARLHLYDFTTATWSHANAGVQMGNAPSQAGGTVTFGRQRGHTWADSSVNWLDGNLAAAAIWPVALTDIQCESLRTSSTLANWSTIQSPSAVWLFNQDVVTDAVQDIVGGADESSRSGTTVLSENPPMPYDIAPIGNVKYFNGTTWVTCNTYTFT